MLKEKLKEKLLKEKKLQSLLVSSLLSFFLLILILITYNLSFVSAARIYGEIFDLDLNPVKNVLVTVNTTPEQKMISTDGKYSFDVPLGTYLVKAVYKVKNTTYSDYEIINIANEGEFRIDFILTESESLDIFANDSEIYELIKLIEMREENKDWIIWLIITILFLFVLVLAIIFLLKKRLKKEKEMKEKLEEILRKPDKFKQEVIKILEKERRILQRDLRKKLNVSEAKLSLVISELEEEGKVKKIKRGRGNILIWQEY